MKKVILYIVCITVVLYVFFCTILYFSQEKIIFPATKLPKDHEYHFPNKFTEIPVKCNDGAILNTILFKADSSKGVVFYLHGNGGNIDSWGWVSPVYNTLGYDVFILDYRSYGKSEGKISNESQLHEDVQTAYDVVLSKYNEDQIIILGYSLGTGLATHLAANNHPKHLVLLAPYYNVENVRKESFPIFPSILLKYKFETDLYVSKVPCTISIFHGDIDKAIPISNSYLLQKKLKPSDSLFVLQNQGHNGIDFNAFYSKKIRELY